MFDLVCYRDCRLRLLRNRNTIRVFWGVALCRIPRLFSVRSSGVAWFSFDLYELYVFVVWSFVIFAWCCCMATTVEIPPIERTPCASVIISYITENCYFSFVDVFFMYVDFYFTRVHCMSLMLPPTTSSQGWIDLQPCVCKKAQPEQPKNSPLRNGDLAMYVCLVPFVIRFGWSFTDNRFVDPVIGFVFLFTD